MYLSYTSKQSDDAITFDEFINGEFSYSTFNGSWWSDTELQWENSVRMRSIRLVTSLSYFVSVSTIIISFKSP